MSTPYNYAIITTACSTGTTTPPPDPDSFASTDTKKGLNTVHFDIACVTPNVSGGYSGTWELWHVTNGSNVRKIPLSGFTNDVTGTTNVSSGACGGWTGTVAGAGILYLVAQSGFSGMALVYMDAGPS